MAAQSPVAETAPESRDDYLLSWAAITQMLAKGFSLSGRERNSCFLNLGEEEFADASAVSGFDFLDDGRALGLVDWDFDGSLDVWALNRNGPQLRFLHNRMGGRGHFLGLRLRGTRGNRDAIGARVEVHLGGPKPVKIIRTVRAGAAFLSQSSKWVHFGLGTSEAVEELVVRWPGGEMERFFGVEVDQQYEIIEGSGTLVKWSPPADRLSPQGAEVEAPVISDLARVVTAARPLFPDLSYENSDGTSVRVDQFVGEPLLVNIWAGWCQPCLDELADFGRHRQAIESAGLRILALNVDEVTAAGEEARREKARRVLAELKYPFDSGTAGVDAISALDALQMMNLGMQIPISTPTSFLLDSKGLVAVIYKGPVEVEQLLQDVAKLESPPRDWRNLATPFPGRWMAPALGSEPVRVALKMVDGGERKAAIAYLRRYADMVRRREIPEASEESGLLSTPLEEVFFVIARLHRQGGEKGEAVAAFQEVLRINPYDRKALLDLGHLYLRDGQASLAAGHLEKLVQHLPQNLDALSLLATAKMQLGELLVVEGLCRRILALDPNHATAYLNLGLVSESKKDFSAAIGHYRAALKILPTWDIALNQLAWILATAPEENLRDGALALDLASRLHQLTRGSQPVFLRTLAAALAENGQFEEALKVVAQAKSLTPARQVGLSSIFSSMRRLFELGIPYRSKGGR